MANLDVDSAEVAFLRVEANPEIGPMLDVLQDKAESLLATETKLKSSLVTWDKTVSLPNGHTIEVSDHKYADCRYFGAKTSEDPTIGEVLDGSWLAADHKPQYHFTMTYDFTSDTPLEHARQYGVPAGWAGDSGDSRTKEWFYDPRDLQRYASDTSPDYEEKKADLQAFLLKELQEDSEVSFAESYHSHPFDTDDQDNKHLPLGAPLQTDSITRVQVLRQADDSDPINPDVHYRFILIARHGEDDASANSTYYYISFGGNMLHVSKATTENSREEDITDLGEIKWLLSLA